MGIHSILMDQHEEKTLPTFFFSCELYDEAFQYYCSSVDGDAYYYFSLLLLWEPYPFSTAIPRRYKKEESSFRWVFLWRTVTPRL